MSTFWFDAVLLGWNYCLYMSPITERDSIMQRLLCYIQCLFLVPSLHSNAAEIDSLIKTSSFICKCKQRLQCIHFLQTYMRSNSFLWAIYGLL